MTNAIRRFKQLSGGKFLINSVSFSISRKHIQVGYHHGGAKIMAVALHIL